MKKFLIFALTSLLILSAHSQTSKDSTTLPNKQLRIALELVERGNFCEKEKNILEKENVLLYKQVDQQDSTISIQDRRMILKDETILLYRNNEVLFKAENKAILEQAYKDKEKSTKELRKQKIKTTFWKFSTLAIAGGAAYLLFK